MTPNSTPAAVAPATTSNAAADDARNHVVNAVELESITQTFPTRTGTFTAVRDVNLQVPRGEFVSIVGPSGCGKSTLIGIIAGLAKPAAGEARVFGRKVTSIDKRVGVVFQRDALLPWRTALDNVALSLRFRKTPKKDAEKAARDWLLRVGLRGFENSYPHQLSGGMRKRVAIAASLVYEPDLLLMDEPFSALDVQTRNLMENDLLDICLSSERTVIFITHDLEEAVGLSDRVVTLTASPATVLSEHRVSLARPRDLLEDKVKPEFISTYERIWEDLRAEVVLAYESDGPAAH